MYEKIVKIPLMSDILFLMSNGDLVLDDKVECWLAQHEMKYQFKCTWNSHFGEIEFENELDALVFRLAWL